MNSARRIGVVVNPTKFADLDDVKDRVAKVCADHGWAVPVFVETTVEDPGVGQAHEALERGIDIPCPLGGDGTVRAVATALVSVIVGNCDSKGEQRGLTTRVLPRAVVVRVR